MEIRQAEMLNHFETGIFAALDEKKEEMMKSGKKVYNLSVGTPDFKPQQHKAEYKNFEDYLAAHSENQDNE